MERSCFSEKTLTLSVLTAEFARCVLQTGAPVTTRSLFFQGLPMALALVLITALTAGAEQRADSFLGTDLRSRVVCGGLGLWFVWEAVETFRQAQELCWENFSSMAMLGLLPLLLWAGWKLEPAVLIRCAPILCWAAALAGLLCLLGLNSQFHWESLMMQADVQTIILPLYPEYFALPLFCPAKQVRCAVWLPVKAFILVGSGNVPVLRAGAGGASIGRAAVGQGYACGGKRMTGQQRALRWLAAGVLVLWCGGFLRAENTEKSMVRALLLTPPTVVAQSWTVGLLYQFPEAAADAADAAARVQLCTGQGNTLQTALTEAERGLPRKASYRLCEYLLLNAETTLKTIRQAETVLKEEPVQGLSARVLCMDLSGEKLAAADGENELFPERLLQVVKEAAPQASRLYESRNALLAPVLILTDGAIENAEEMLLLTETGNTRLTPAESQMAQLLLGQSGEHTFPLGSGQVTFRRCVVSVEAVEDGFAVTLTGQRRAGTALPTAAQCAALEQLCVQTVQRCWENGYDLLSLGAVRALKQGTGREALTTKNACPQVQADVSFLQF